MSFVNTNEMSGINFLSLEKVCHPSQQLMVYGWAHTDYTEVIDFLKCIDEDTNTSIRKYFDCWLGDKFKKDARVTTLEGRKMERIEYDSIPNAEHCAKMCKSAIVNLVLENCKRIKDALCLIPLLFCIDIDNNPYPKTVDSIATRNSPDNGNVTNKELRRIYKLCHFKDDFISSVALKMVKFVKVHINTQNEYEFEELKPFWEDPKWSDLWELRQKSKKIKSKVHRWESQLIKGVASYIGVVSE